MQKQKEVMQMTEGQVLHQKEEASQPPSWLRDIKPNNHESKTLVVVSGAAPVSRL